MALQLDLTTNSQHLLVPCNNWVTRWPSLLPRLKCSWKDSGRVAEVQINDWDNFSGVIGPNLLLVDGQPCI